MPKVDISDRKGIVVSKGSGLFRNGQRIHATGDEIDQRGFWGLQSDMSSTAGTLTEFGALAPCKIVRWYGIAFAAVGAQSAIWTVTKNGTNQSETLTLDATGTGQVDDSGAFADGTEFAIGDRIGFQLTTTATNAVGCSIWLVVQNI